MSTNSLFDALASRPDDAVVLRGATSVWTAKAVRDEWRKEFGRGGPCELWVDLDHGIRGVGRRLGGHGSGR